MLPYFKETYTCLPVWRSHFVLICIREPHEVLDFVQPRMNLRLKRLASYTWPINSTFYLRIDSMHCDTYPSYTDCVCCILGAYPFIIHIYARSIVV